MRTHHLFIGVLIFSLFAVILYSESVTFLGRMDVSEADYLGGVSDGNASGLFTELDILSDTKDEVIGMADNSPGGSESIIPGGSDTTEGSMQKSGVGVVASAGKFLWSVPKELIYTLADFLHINKLFAIVASTIIILIIAIIVVSSILRNKL